MKATTKKQPGLKFMASGMTETTAAAHAKKVTRSQTIAIDELAPGRALRVNGRVQQPGAAQQCIQVYADVLREIDALTSADNKSALYNVLLMAGLRHYKEQPQIINAAEFFRE